MKKKILLILVVILAGIQLIQPERSNPPIDPQRTIQSRMTVPADIDDVLKRACNDCHSHETVWPWYSYVAPVSWLVAHDVNEGRRELNFSDWAKYKPDRLVDKLEEVSELVSERDMPMKIYLPLHPEARLTDDEIRRLSEWAKDAAAQIPKPGSMDQQKSQKKD